MQKKQMVWKTKGMNQDLSVSAFNPEFAFENMNLRLSTNSGNTQLSWVNEKGTAEASLDRIDMSPSDSPLAPGASGYSLRYKDYLYGHPVGTAVVGNKLIVFTTHTEGIEFTTGVAIHDFIYQLRLDGDNTLGGKLLYKGNLGFSDEHPLETLVNYESEDIQKVYWTDGTNQPRVINIAGNIKDENDTQFDFLPAVGSGAISVSRSNSNSGIFSPGVIQYCFTYYNKHGQQSNVVDTSSLHYISYSDRGASPESKVSCSFTITITNVDTNFDYVRLYSIQRTSLDAVPIVKIVSDIKTGVDPLSYTDNGTTGAIIDPTELLYIGGREIKALTMTDKDGTLFLGNISMPHANIESLQNIIRRQSISISFYNGGDEVNHVIKQLALGSPSGVYYHKQQLDRSLEEITTFKGGDTYRFGFQLQKNTGEWSEPIWLDDVRNAKYPQFDVTNHIIKLVYAEATLNFNDYDFDFGAYKKIRPVIVYPNIADREVLCQGVLNPTVFNVQDRIDNSPFAQASWYFRPYTGAPSPKPGRYIKTSQNEAQTLLQKEIQDVITTACSPISNANFSLDEAFVGKTTAVYVLVATVTPDNIKKIRSNHCLYADYREPSSTNITRTAAPKDTNSGKTKKYEFLGIIPLVGKDLDNSDLTNIYAFINSSPWPSEYGSITNYTDGGALRYRNVSDVSTTPTPFNMYEYMSLLSDSMFEHTYYLSDSRLKNSSYNPNQQTGPDNKKYKDFVFKFYDTRKFYQVTFINIAADIEALTPSPVDPSSSTDISSTYKGTAIPFEHYESLLCASELGDNSSAAKQVEIQGSYKLYDTPFTAVEEFNKPAGDGTQTVGLFTFSVSNDALPSNTQFFVDQSIVTLNSPDIEFDTDVQTYGTEEFGLRVVGVIPLTANVSAHHITTSSNMLENAHNMSEAYKDWSGGKVDKMLESEVVANYLDSRGHVFGSGELSVNTYLPHSAGKMGTGRHLVSDYLWNDVVVASSNRSEDKTVSSLLLHDFLIHPWHRTGSLNNDYRSSDKASSLLRTKKESNLLWSPSSFYVKDGFPPTVFSSVNFQIHLSENAEVLNYRLPAQNSGLQDVNYYPNIDKVLYNKNGYLPIIKDGMDADLAISDVTSPISMKYKSGSHAVIALNGSSVPILPYVSVTVGDQPVNIGKLESGELSGTTTFWGASSLSFSQNLFNSPATPQYQHNDFLLLGELYKVRATGYEQNLFGGNNPSAIRANNWQVGGDAVNLVTTGDVTLRWTIGDTYYQRYDCLKTYAFTPEDTNQLVEVLSFMCETHVNLDGRYDRNRGQIDNTMMKPEIFNLLNPVYSQQDNFFTYKQIDEGESKAYPNQLCFTGTKNSGADVDEWTHITLGGVLELDGDKGQLTSLQRLNNNIIAFQEKGISRILYNENAAISTTAGVPIELGNSGKVQGKQYISNTIGCSNKWSICNTPNGIYFMDSNEKSIYLFNGQLENLSIKGGMNSWCKKNIGAGLVWNPADFGQTGETSLSSFVSYYDRENQDVLFVNKDTALTWSEKFGTFTSFYDYGGGSYFNSIQDIGVWAVPGEYTEENEGVETTVCEDSTLFYLHNKGNYGVFFGSRKPYWMTLVGNPEPLRDKTFTNLEFRACIEGEGQTLNTGNYALHPTYKHFLPFNELECWDEYQHGVATLQDKDGHDAMKHFLQDNTAHLNRKFRIWRCDVPRDNVEIQSNMPIEPTGSPNATVREAYRKAKAKYDNYVKEQGMGVYRFAAKPLDRIRNPWMYLKLTKNIEEEEDQEGETIQRDLPKAEIHDVMMSYFV